MLLITDCSSNGRMSAWLCAIYIKWHECAKAHKVTSRMLFESSDAVTESYYHLCILNDEVLCSFCPWRVGQSICVFTRKKNEKKTTMYGTNPSGSDHLVRRHDLEWEKLTRSYLENFWSNFDAILHDRLMYLAWFYKTNKRWHSWPRSLTLRVQIDCSTQFALPRSQFNK